MNGMQAIFLVIFCSSPLFPSEIDDGIMLGGHVGIGKITLDGLNRKPCFFQQQLHFMAEVIG